MRRIRAIISYPKLTIPERIELARNSTVKMGVTGSAFTTPDVTYVAMNTQATATETAFNAAQGGDKGLISASKKANRALGLLLRKQAMYVDRIADGDEAIILSSGFDASKQPEYAAKPMFTAINGKTGEMILTHRAMKGARSWVYQTSPDGITWTQVGIDAHKTFLVENLTPLTKMYFRASYITITGQSDWCNAVIEVVK